MDQEYYTLLGLKKPSSEDEIKKAYKQLALKWHPDRNPQNTAEATERFKAISEAYSVLSDPNKKQEYDAYGKGGAPQQSGFPFPFGGGFPFGQHRQVKSPDILHEIEVTLKELYCGCTKQFTFNRNVICKVCDGNGATQGNLIDCSSCNGRGVKIGQMNIMPGFVINQSVSCTECSGSGKAIRIKCPQCLGKKLNQESCTLTIPIERGAKNGDRQTAPQMSHEVPGLQTGDFIVQLKQKNHDVFQRHGNNLIYKRSVPLYAALCGFTLQIEHLDGRQIQFVTEDIITPGCRRSLKSEGMILADGTRGDLLIDFSVDFPTSLTDLQKQKVMSLLKDQ